MVSLRPKLDIVIGTDTYTLYDFIRFTKDKFAYCCVKRNGEFLGVVYANTRISTEHKQVRYFAPCADQDTIAPGTKGLLQRVCNVLSVSTLTRLAAMCHERIIN